MIESAPSPLNASNPWIVSVQEAARSPPAWLALAWTVVLSSVTVLVLPGLVADRAPAMSGDGLAALTVNRAILYLVLFSGFYATALIGVFWELRPPRLGGWPVRPAILIGLAIGAGCLVAALGLDVLVGAAKPVVGRPSAVFGAPGIAFAGVLVLFQCWAEEALFRGWLQPILAERWRVPTGVSVAALAFGLAHSVGTPGLLAVVNAILAGLMFGLLALRTGSLAAPIAAHFGYNWAEQSIFGLTPNPGVDQLGSVFNFDLAGAPIFSGGRDELNGSVTLFLILGLAIYLLIRWPPGVQPEAQLAE